MGSSSAWSGVDSTVVCNAFRDVWNDMKEEDEVTVEYLASKSAYLGIPPALVF